MPVDRTDAIVIGAGIIGLASAYALARRGLRVQVLERDPFATGATVRNFGMVWPIGQPLGARRELALQSRDLWLEVCRAAGMWHQPCGSLHLAYADDELAVLQEFCAIAGPGVVDMIEPAEVLAMSPVVRREGLRGAMRSVHEICVDPREAAAKLATFLADRFAVTFSFGEAAVVISSGRVETSTRELEAPIIVHCPGPHPYDAKGQRLVDQGMRPVKLQMLRAKPKSREFRIGAHLCAGLTSLHYQNFEDCPSLPALRDRFRQERASELEHGIHLLVSQHADGTLTIGDSHHYGEHHRPYALEEVDNLILGYLNTFLPIESFEITERWIGFYGKHPTEPYLFECPEPGVWVLGGVGGAGMTLSFGLAEQKISEILVDSGMARSAS